MAHRFGKELSRRNFLTGAAVIGAGAALAGCSSPAADDAEVSAAAGVDAGAGAATGMASSFMTPPKPVDESSITSTVDTDVVVIGAGVSGLCLGARLADRSTASIRASSMRTALPITRPIRWESA